MNNKLVIIGSGDLGQLIAYHAAEDSKYNVVGFFDDFIEPGNLINGIKVLGKINEVESLYREEVFDQIIIAIGYKHLQFREAVFFSFKNKIPFATVVHKSCTVDKSCKIGEGSCLLPGSILDRNVVIEENVLVNIGCNIAHDTKIGAHSFLSPSVSVAGFVTIGKRCNIGISTTIIDNVEIKSDIQTGGGTVVINDLETKGLYVGNPSRFVDK